MFSCHNFKQKKLARWLKQKEKNKQKTESNLKHFSIVLYKLQDTGTAAFYSFRRDPCGPGTANVSRNTYLSIYL